MRQIYNHLSLLERERLYSLREQGMSFREIGIRLGRTHTSLSREYERNTKYGKDYFPCFAQRRADRVGERQRRKAPLKSPLVFLYVRKHLREDGWSPEQIAGRLPIDHPRESVHFETIYRYVYLSRNRKYDYRKYLTLKRTKRMRKLGRKVKRLSKIPGAQSIELRSKVVQKRKQPGHWETDNMEGKRSDKTTVSVTVERVTRYTNLAKLVNRKSQTKILAITKNLTTFPRILKRTVTTDNGAENTNHQDLTNQVGVAVYFCHPYHSWEKGTVENTVGRIRKFIPKGITIDSITQEEIQEIENRVNNTPRRCLNFLTPNEKMQMILEKEQIKLII